MFGRLALALAWVCVAGCGKPAAPTADPQPFRVAVAQYLDQNNMGMEIKEIKKGPTVEGDRAMLEASLVRKEAGGPSATWRFRFEKAPGGAWKAVEHDR